MNPLRKFAIFFWLMILILALAACLVGGDEADSPRSSDGGQPDRTTTGESTSSQLQRTDRPPSDQRTDAPASSSPPPDMPVDDWGNPLVITIRSIDDAASVNSYRANIYYQAKGDAFEASGTEPLIQAGMLYKVAMVKVPPAYSIEIEVDGKGIGTYYLIDGRAYSVTSEESRINNVGAPLTVNDLLSPINFDAMIEDFDKLTFKGEEQFNGRRVYYMEADGQQMRDIYRDANGEPQIEGHWELWIDAEEGFITKMDFEGTGTGFNPAQPALVGTMRIMLDYYDLNADIEIEVP